MVLTSDELEELLRRAKQKWHCAVRVQVSAGWGCTVLEVFERDTHTPSVPMQRVLVSGKEQRWHF